MQVSQKIFIHEFKEFTTRKQGKPENFKASYLFKYQY